jgi:hypothetical protein
MKLDSKGRIMGCGYCALEKECNIRDPKVNKAKEGCKQYVHYEDTK